jgi:hypothetical protein
MQKSKAKKTVETALAKRKGIAKVTALAKRQGKKPEGWPEQKGKWAQPIPADQKALTEEEIIEAFDLLGITTKLTDERTKRLFVAVAKANNLNPLRREIHAVERRQKVVENIPGKGDITNYITVLTPVTGFEVYIDRAEQTGRLAYWNVQTSGSVATKDLRSTVTIARRDWSREFVWTVWHSECAVDNPMWKKEPTHMTEKVAISRAFRLCFRDVLRNMPYTWDEEMTIQHQEERELVAEPKALPGVTTDAEGKVKEKVAAPAAQSGPSLADQVKAAKINLNAGYVYLACVYGPEGAILDEKGAPRKLAPDGRTDCFYLTNDEELEEMRNASKEAGDDLGKLRDLAVRWNQMLTTRKAEHGLKGK